jgi:hypothetical protein
MGFDSSIAQSDLPEYQVMVYNQAKHFLCLLIGILRATRLPQRFSFLKTFTRLLHLRMFRVS